MITKRKTINITHIKKSNKWLWSYCTHLRFNGSICNTVFSRTLNSWSNRFCFPLPIGRARRIFESTNKPRGLYPPYEHKKMICKQYLLASSWRSLASYSLLGGHFGKHEGLQASGSALKNWRFGYIGLVLQYLLKSTTCKINQLTKSIPPLFLNIRCIVFLHDLHHVRLVLSLY
jgi:hypothetical protein